MWRVLTIVSAMTLGACEAGPQQAKPVATVQTATGAQIKVFRITRSNALGVTPVSQRAITARALEICPDGYREVSRRAEAERRISGVIYTDVTVGIFCT